MTSNGKKEEEISFDTLKGEVVKVMRSSKLEDLTLKKIRQLLKVKFPRQAVRKYKITIAQIVKNQLNLMSKKQAAADSSDSTKPALKKSKKKRKKTATDDSASSEGEVDDAHNNTFVKEEKKPWGPTYLCSSALADICKVRCGKDAITRSQVVKKVWEYIREQDLQSTENRREIICDAKLKKVFKNEAKVSMFGMNKFYSEHLTATGEVIPRAKSAYSKKPKKKKRKSSPNAVNNMPLYKLSADLSEVCGGETELRRTSVVKKVWEYIRENDLQVPENRRNIKCDAKLRRVFDGEAQVTMFSMNKYFSNHLTALEKKKK